MARRLFPLVLAALLLAGCPGSAGPARPGTPASLRGPLDLAGELAAAVKRRDARGFIGLFSPHCRVSCTGLTPFNLQGVGLGSPRAVVWSPALKRGGLVQALGRLFFSYQSYARLEMTPVAVRATRLRASLTLRVRLEGKDMSGRRRTDQGLMLLSLRRNPGGWRVYDLETFGLHSVWWEAPPLAVDSAKVKVPRAPLPATVDLAWPGDLTAAAPWISMDADGDGRFDLVTASGGRVLVLPARGGGYGPQHELLSVPGCAARTLAATGGSLFVGCAERGSAVWRRSGGGDWSRLPGSSVDGEVAHALWADLDGQGAPDLFMVREQPVPGMPGRDLIRTGDGKLHPGPLGTGVGREACAADIDQDGDTDLVVISQGEPPRLWLNRGNGKLEFDEAGHRLGLGSVAGATACAVADFDGDGRFDLFLGGRQPANGHLFGRAGVGTPGEGLLPSREHQERLTRHTRGDVIFFNRAGARGAMTLEPHPLPGRRWTAAGAVAMDVDLDGVSDLLLRRLQPTPAVEARWWWQFFGPALAGQKPAPLKAVPRPTVRVELLSNLGRQGKVWVEASHIAGLPDGQRAVAAMHGRSGQVGLALEGQGGALSLARLQPAGQGAQILLRLWGKGPNVDATGTLVVLTAGGRRQVRQAGHVTGLPGNPLGMVHFGLGGALRAEEVRVRWPSGKWQRFVDLPADRMVGLEEGGGATWKDPEDEAAPATTPDDGQKPATPAEEAGPPRTLVLVHGPSAEQRRQAAALCQATGKAKLPPELKTTRLGPGKLPGCSLPDAEETPALTSAQKTYKVLMPLLVLLDAEGKLLKFVGGGLGPEHLGL